MEKPAAEPPGQVPQPANQETAPPVAPAATAPSTTPTTGMKAVVVTTTAPVRADEPPEDGGSTGNGDEAVPADGAATSSPVTNPSFTTPAGSGGRGEGNLPGMTAGGTDTISGRTTVPTTTAPAPSGPATRPGTGGNGATPGGPDGQVAMATPTDAPMIAPAGAGPATAGSWHSPRTGDVAANDSLTAQETGTAGAGGDGRIGRTPASPEHRRPRPPPDRRTAAP